MKGKQQKTGLRGSLFFYVLLLHSKVQVGRRRTEGGVRLRRASRNKSARMVRPRLLQLIPDTAHTVRGMLCFLRESSPPGLQGFPGRQVGFPQICVRVGDIFHPRRPQEAVVWPELSAAPSETPLWEQCLVSHTLLFQLPLHIETHT